MRVLHVISDGTWGGAQRHVRDLISGVQGAQCSLASGSEGHLTREVQSKGTPVALVPGLGRRDSVVALPRAVRHLGWLIERLAPEVVHAHGAKASTVAKQALRRGGPVLVYTSHGFAFADPTRPAVQRTLLKSLERQGLERIAAFIGVSRSECALARTLGFQDERIHHIPNGVPMGPGGLPRQGPIRLVGFAGRWVPEKGIDVLIRLAAHLPEGVTLEVRGEGPRKMPLGINRPAVRVGGWVEDIPSWLRGVDLLVLPSRKEALPYILLEAMAEAVPVVAFAVGGIPEVLSDGLEGRLVPPGDDEEFVTAVLDLIRAPESATGMAIKGFQRVRSAFTLDLMLEQTAEVYRGLLERGVA